MYILVIYIRARCTFGWDGDTLNYKNVDPIRFNTLHFILDTIFNFYNSSSESGRLGASTISFLRKARAIAAFPINLLRVATSSVMSSFSCRFLEDCTRRPLLVHCTGRLSLNLSVSTSVKNANPGMPSLAHCCHHHLTCLDSEDLLCQWSCRHSRWSFHCLPRPHQLAGPHQLPKQHRFPGPHQQ